MRELKKYKKICQAALSDASMPVVEAALKKGEDLRFMIKEHKELKRMHFKIKEEEELQRELAELAKLKGDGDLNKMKNIVDRADNIGFASDQMAKLKEMYERANEIKQVEDTLLKACDSFVDIDSLRSAIERAKSLDDIPEELKQRALLILQRYEKEIELFRNCLDAFKTGCPPEAKGAAQAVAYDHIEPVLHEFRMAQPFYNQKEFPQHLYEFEIMFNMRKAVQTEDFDKMQAALIKTNDITQNEHFMYEVNLMKEVVTHYGEVEKIKETLWKAIDVMDLNTIRYCMDQGDLYKVNWETVERADDGVHQACRLPTIFNSVIAEATVAVNVMEREIMTRWFNTMTAFKIENEVTQALRYLLFEIDENKFNQLAFKAALKLRDEKLIIFRTIKMKSFEFEGEKNMNKWILSSCHLMKDPEEWARTAGMFKNKKEKAKGFYFHTKSSIHESLTKDLNKEQNKKALTIFKNIRGFAGDKSVPYPHMSGVEVLKVGMTHPDLRDEIYAQILKQLLNNKIEISRLRMYKLLILCLKCFAPDKMENYVDFFIRKKMKNCQKLLYILYERVCISPCMNFGEDALVSMVKNAKKPEDIAEVEEKLPDYNAGSHPHLAMFSGSDLKKDSKTIKLK
jgi:tetratricopeptide (TPR) repeat protein